MRSDVADDRTEIVRRFYTEAPFPGYGPNDSLARLRERAARSDLARLLDQAIPSRARVLDLGCGTGQMTLFLASGTSGASGAGNQRLVVGADLVRASLRLGQQAAQRFGVSRTCFVETDLRRPALSPGTFDVVLALGVLHHTPNPRESFAAVARLVRPGGIVVVGLYNAFARVPHRLRRLLARLSGMRWIPFDPVLRDRESEGPRREAWLRDQYLHPEEHRHTLGQVQRWFRDNQIEYLRTYPSALLHGKALEGDELFTADEDNWWLEGVLAQMFWTTTLAAEGGLFVVVGRRND